MFGCNIGHWSDAARDSTLCVESITFRLVLSLAYKSFALFLLTDKSASTLAEAKSAYHLQRNESVIGRCFKDRAYYSLPCESTGLQANSWYRCDLIRF